MRLLPPGVAASALALRAAVLVLPCLALVLALPEVPHWAVSFGVPLSAAVWARTPDHAIGVVPPVLVGGWWASHGVVDWRLLLVAALLLGAHVAATLASYGPVTLALDPHLARLWLGRALLVLVPVPLAWLAVRGLDPAWAPPGTWLVTGVLTVVLLLVTARLVRAEAR
ncbi:hypothetical protein GCM10011376_14450 [Nocardioides flavus (ex Wang et al. 2016)]|uniref:Rod shape-determining protein MreD n=2 Tax=Nocardioides flavus (ex Wang et al. 2016) TaxID=2058780 RepID=A0ABQ3HGT0_9ACTN|nr:hypothetical protein GCM10011376_14450 [Nocardioides flavus (ex Wang et al. 2016)]